MASMGSRQYNQGDWLEYACPVNKWDIESRSAEQQTKHEATVWMPT